MSIPNGLFTSARGRGRCFDHGLRDRRAASPASHRPCPQVRLELADGARTMAHVACYDAAETELRVAVLRGQARLEPWCAARG